MVFINPIDRDEASNLREISSALENPRDSLLSAYHGPLSSAIASAMEQLLTKEHEKRWTVALTGCFPDDEGARTSLARAFCRTFRQGRIENLSLRDMDSTHEVYHDMLLAIFGMADAEDESQHDQHSPVHLRLGRSFFGRDMIPRLQSWAREVSTAIFGRMTGAENEEQHDQHVPVHLRLERCVFEHDMIPHLQPWAREVSSFSEVTIQGKCFRWPDTPTTTECINKIFEQATKKPTTLYFQNVPLVGDMECLRDWNLQSITFGSCRIRTMSGLSTMASSLKKLEVHLTKNQDISLSGIVPLLEDPSCCLENLSIQSGRADNEGAIALFRALSNVHSLIRLDIPFFRTNDRSTWRSMIDYVSTNPPSLKHLIVHGSILKGIPSASAVEDICQLLISKNNTLEEFEVNQESRVAFNIAITTRPYLARNRAGRRILSDERVSPSLIVELLGKVQQMEISTAYEVKLGKLLVLRADATFHLIQEGLNILFLSRKRKRMDG